MKRPTAGDVVYIIKHLGALCLNGDGPYIVCGFRGTSFISLDNDGAILVIPFNNIARKFK